MAENRLKIGKQLQKSVIPGSIVKTDANNEQEYVQPGLNGQVLTVVGGIPIWANPALVPDIVTTLVDNGNGTATYTNESGVAVTIPIGGVTLVNNGNGTYTFTSADGSTVTISDTSISTLVNNGNGTYTYTDESGVTTTFSTNDILTLITNTIVGHKIADYTNEAGTVVAINETITSIVDNGDGTATFTNEAGITITIPIGYTTIVDNGNGSFTATYPDGSTTTFAETVTTIVPIANGYQYVSEDGTTYGVTFLFDNTTPSNPQLLVQVDGVTQSAIPLNSYDVNISTTGGFVLDPLTDVITITETDGETHVIDLTPLRTTLTSVDGSVEIVQSVNPDGSTNYDLTVGVPNAHIVATAPYDPLNPLAGWVAPSNPIQGNTAEVKFTDGTVVHYTYDGVAWIVDFVEAPVVSIVHSNETQAIPYTGTELPVIAGVTVGDTTDIQFSDGTVVSYTWDGTAWIPDFQQTWAEQRICLNTAAVAFTPADLNNPLVSEVDAWATANLTIQQRENGTKLVYFVPGDGGSCDVPDYEWTLNKGSQLVTLSNKVEKISNTLFIDNVRGNNTTGLRNYREFPFKTFNASLPKLNDGDWLQYDNTTETIAATNNIRSSSINHFYDFGRGSITINNASSGLIGFGLSTPSKNVHIKGDNITLANTTLVSSGDGNVDFNIKKLTTNSYIITSMANTNISIKDFNTTAQGGWFTANNKNININVENLNQTLNNSIDSWTDGIFQLEANTAGLPSSNNVNFNVYYGNIRQNAVKTSVYNSNGILNNCNVKVHVNNLFQSTTLASYPIFALNAPFATFSAARFGVDDPIYTGCQFTFEGNNLVTDSPLSSEVSGGVLTNTHIKYNITNSLVRKGFSIYVGDGPINSAPINLNNSSISYKGSYTNEYSGLSMIYIKANLTNGSKIIFDGYFKGVSNITFLNTILDATSKIIFKGKYDLGNGFFDISGVTGAGADNIYFEDCTIVTNNAECIVSGTAKNIKILDVRSNKPTSANVTELVSSIIVNSVIN